MLCLILSSLLINIKDIPNADFFPPLPYNMAKMRLFLFLADAESLHHIFQPAGLEQSNVSLSSLPHADESNESLQTSQSAVARISKTRNSDDVAQIFIFPSLTPYPNPIRLVLLMFYKMGSSLHIYFTSLKPLTYTPSRALSVTLTI